MPSDVTNASEDGSGLTTPDLFARYVAPTYGRFSIALSEGRGPRVTDETGKTYLDFGTGIAVCSLGHSHPVMLEALAEQGQRLQHCSNLYLIREQGLLAREVVENIVASPGKVFFCNSGAEANEALIKLARKFGHAATAADGSPRHEVITFEGSFHGRTMAGISATAQAKVKAGFEPLLPGFTHLPWNDLTALRTAFHPGVAAVLLEPIQGEGGIRPANPDFLAGLAELCREHNALLLFDEVQCGVGRTGHLCGWRSIGAPETVLPDAVSWAKGLGGGIPIGAIWISNRPVAQNAPEAPLCDVLGPGSHGSTFGGGPLVAHVSRRVLEEIRHRDLPANARAMGVYLRSEIESWQSPWIRGVRGFGLMLGIVLDAEALASLEGFAESTSPAVQIVKDLAVAGLLTVPSGNDVVRLLPPLDLSRDDATEALDLLKSYFASLQPVPSPS